MSAVGSFCSQILNSQCDYHLYHLFLPNTSAIETKVRSNIEANEGEILSEIPDCRSEDILTSSKRQESHAFKHH